MKINYFRCDCCKREFKSQPYLGVNIIDDLCKECWEYTSKQSQQRQEEKFPIQIKHEDENFEMEIPSLGVLKSGYYVSSLDDYYTCQNCDSEHLLGCYKIGNWFATEKQAAKELELRKTKMFVNKLIEWSDETSMIGYNETYIKNSSRYGIYYYDSIIRSYCLHNCNYDFRIYLKSYESANLFIKQINLPKNETHRDNLIKILKSGKL